MPNYKPIIDRFLAKVQKTDSCWLWVGTKQNMGYGEMVINKKKHLAHRVAYTLHKGEIPKGMVLRHTCDTPLCVNPEHLILGTQTDNMYDMLARNRNTKVKGKLTFEQVQEIRKLWESRQYTCTELGKMFNVHHTQILRINKHWKNI